MDSDIPHYTGDSFGLKALCKSLWDVNLILNGKTRILEFKSAKFKIPIAFKVVKKFFE